MSRCNSWRALPVLLWAVQSVAFPVRASELRVLLDAEAGVRSDGNYGQAARARVAPEGPEDIVEPEDVEDTSVGRASLRLQLSYDLRERLLLALGYSPSYERTFGDDQELTGTAHRFDLGLRGDLSRRLAIDLRERLFKGTNLDFEVPLNAADSLAAARRGDQLQHSLDVGLTQALTRRFSLRAGIGHTQREFEDPALFDAETLGADLGAAWQWSEFQSIEAMAGLQTFEFENGRQTDVKTLGVGYVQPLGRDTELRLEAGSFSVETVRPGRVVAPAEPETPGESEPVPPGTSQELERVESTGWRGAAQLSQQRRLFHWDLGYRHDVAPGYGLGRETRVDNVFAGISTTIGRRLVLGLDGNASRHRDLEEREELVGRSGELLEFAAGTARVSWAILPALRLTGGYSRVWQRSDVEAFDDLSYGRYFLGLAFRIFERGDSPRTPDELNRRGEPTDDAEPDDQ